MGKWACGLVGKCWWSPPRVYVQSLATSTSSLVTRTCVRAIGGAPVPGAREQEPRAVSAQAPAARLRPRTGDRRAPQGEGPRPYAGMSEE